MSNVAVLAPPSPKHAPAGGLTAETRADALAPAIDGGSPPADALAGLATAAAASLALAACGGGTTTAPPADPPASAAAAARFVHQASIGATSADLDALGALGYTGWLDHQLYQPPAQTNYDWLIAKGFNATTNMYSSNGADAAAWRSMIAEANPVVQRLALFWSEYFVVSMNGLPIAWPQFAAAAYLDLLTAHAAGNFRDLLKAVTLSPAMGEYLSLRGSVKADASGIRHPDENYAREVMQLFTIGLIVLNQDGTPVLNNGQTVPSYTQADVTGLAAAFTGWEFNGSSTSPDYTRAPMVQIASRHSTAAASFLGTTVPAGSTGEQALEIILDTLFQHPNLPPFLARQMIQRFVTSNPSPAYVSRVAAAFINDGSGVRGNLRATFKAVLLDSEARTPGAAGQGRVREPMLRLMQWGRSFAATSVGAWSIGDTSDASSRMGQSPLRSPSVFNFFAPDYTPPGSALAAQGLVAPELQLLNESSVASYLNFMQRVITSGVGDVTAAYTTELGLASNAGALVAHLNLLLAANQLDPAAVFTITGAVTAMPAVTSTDLLNRVHAAIFLVMAAPSFQVLK